MENSTKEVIHHKSVQNLLVQVYSSNGFTFIESVDPKTAILYGPKSIFQNMAQKTIEEFLQTPMNVVEINEEFVRIKVNPYDDPIMLIVNNTLERDEIVKKMLVKQINFLEKKLEEKDVMRYGATKPEDWVTYSDGITVIVDISKFGFKNTPLIFTSLCGTSCHWTTTGATSIYSPTPKQFQVYVRTGTVEGAKSQNWYLNYFLISQDQRSDKVKQRKA